MVEHMPMSRVNSYFEPVTEERIQEVARLVVDAVQPEQVILFGSQADGTARASSDIDLLVKIKDCDNPGQKRHEAYSAISTALLRVKLPCDILVYTESEFEQRKNNRYGVVSDAHNHGRSLYARAS
jgi:predicted nucleotidyltransferase